MRRLRIAHLYPRDMNIYGDLGNVITLRRRLEWRRYAVDVVPVEVGTPFRWEDADIIFGGGGQDSGQLRIADDVGARADDLRRAAADGVPMLLICGMYQLFGHWFTTLGGRTILGIGIFNATTRADVQRLIGNVVVDSRFGRLVGFENHSGQTTLGVDQAPLGIVRKGHGNNLHRDYEGAVTREVVGCYLHGPVLPKNPKLADHLIAAALIRRYGSCALPKLDDSLEREAAARAAARAA
jgi:lipid II isoglutaminyl synthase (glutamine-hydrolysing)